MSFIFISGCGMRWLMRLQIKIISVTFHFSRPNFFYWFCSSTEHWLREVFFSSSFSPARYWITLSHDVKFANTRPPPFISFFPPLPTPSPWTISSCNFQSLHQIREVTISTVRSVCNMVKINRYLPKVVRSIFDVWTDEWTERLANGWRNGGIYCRK